jgi:choline dehydrogenase-like flavoprotein
MTFSGTHFVVANQVRLFTRRQALERAGAASATFALAAARRARSGRGLVNHQMGTMRMGSDPDTSVVDPGQRFWGISNLYAIDGSVFPTSGGYNPTLTIEALAWRTAGGIVRAERYREWGGGAKRHRRHASAL